LQAPAAGIPSLLVTVTKTAGPACAWVARSTSTTWLTVVGPNTGQGSGSFTISIAPNTGGLRGGEINLTNNPNVGYVRVSQAASGGGTSAIAADRRR